MSSPSKSAQALVGRLASYWRPWRAALLLAAGAFIGLAVATEQRWLAAAFGIISVVPLAVLLGLTGDRQAQHHRELAKTTKALKAGAVSQRKVETMVSEAMSVIESTRERASLECDAPSHAELALVVDFGATDSFADAVTALCTRLPTSVKTYLVDPGHLGQAPGRLAAQVLSNGGSLSLLDGQSHSFSEVALSLPTRFVVALSPHVEMVDVAPILNLVVATPTMAEPWVAARQHPARPDLVMFRLAAFREAGLSVEPGALDLSQQHSLAALGFVCDIAESVSSAPTSHSRSRLATGVTPHSAAEAVALLPQAAYHTYELFPLAAELELLGQPARVLAADRWMTSLAVRLHKCSVPVFDQPSAGVWVEQLRALVTMNDWAKDERALIECAKNYGVPTFAKVEGAQDFNDLDVGRDRQAYQTADVVLCQGQNDMDAVAEFGGTGLLVGSSRLEAAWLSPPRPVPSTPLAVINLNFTWGVLNEARDEFLQTALEGCKRAGIAAVVSAHPFEKPGADLPVSNLSMTELLEKATVLISRFSTVPFEAMARGVPFIYHNPHGEKVPTFADANGAFDTSVSAQELSDAIAAASAWVDGYRSRCEPFFRQQVDVDGQRSSAQRTAAAIAEVLRR